MLCTCPGTVRGQGSIREGAFCPMPCIRGLAQGLLSLLPGVWTERRRSIPEILLMAFALYPVTRLPGHFYRERGSPARFTAGLLPTPRRSLAGAFSSGKGQPRPAQHRAFALYPGLARWGVLIGIGTVPPGSAPGFCPYPSPRPPVVFLPLLQERPGRSGKNPAESGF